MAEISGRLTCQAKLQPREMPTTSAVGQDRMGELRGRNLLPDFFPCWKPNPAQARTKGATDKQGRERRQQRGQSETERQSIL